MFIDAPMPHTKLCSKMYLLALESDRGERVTCMNATWYQIYIGLE